MRVSVAVLFKATKMGIIVKQVNFGKLHVSLSQLLTVQFQVDSHLQQLAHPVTLTLCQHPANQENVLYERS